MTIVLSEDNMPNVYRLDTHRPMPAGLDQQGRRATRGFGQRAEFVDTVATDYGSADALGDDQAERHSAWGAIDECAAPEGGRYRKPSRTGEAAPGLLAVLLWPLVIVGLLALVAIFSTHWPMAWPLA